MSLAITKSLPPTRSEATYEDPTLVRRLLLIFYCPQPLWQAYHISGAVSFYGRQPPTAHQINNSLQVGSSELPGTLML